MRAQQVVSKRTSQFAAQRL